MDDLREMLKGVLEGAVLNEVARGETYGYQIAHTLNGVGFDSVSEGTVYAVLMRLERAGAVKSRKLPSPTGPPRKFYQLTKLGKTDLKNFWRKWDFLSGKLNELRRKK
ncbi:MAG: PadR family transcriptional regulator [Candidatus Nomurabacteria bacterium]|jgi:DNA-binding PadR family transcriptional regulator|nr:PadR family transcriptional regulator [Candidatus Nomurabacteria bacterium]